MSVVIDTDRGDIVLDTAGNWRVESGKGGDGEVIAQVIRTFRGECVFNTDLGVEWARFLGKKFSEDLEVSFFASLVAEIESLSFVGSVEASASFFDEKTRNYRYTLRVVTSSEEEVTIAASSSGEVASG